jgi:hypothetical protein
MGDADKQTVLMREIQIRLDKKLKEQEVTVIEYWKQQFDKLLLLKPEGIASLQLQIRRISDMMQNRVNMLKKE